MEAIILAGGMGSRLREVVADVPKPMAPVGGRPFLFYVLQWLEKYPVDKIIFSTGYKSEIISDFFGDSFNKIPVEYSVEVKPLGTGGAAKLALQKTTGQNILILNGDTYFPIDLNRFLSFHASNKNKFSIALKRMKDFSRYGSVECNDNAIIKFHEKMFVSDGLINGGIYLIDRNFIEWEQFPEVFSLEKDLFEKVASSSVLRCLVFDDMFIDIGIPEDYARAGSIMKIG
jgi:D-glycero-alpha-D-manno-heptose 1-phosphate guanylyltransferase